MPVAAHREVKPEAEFRQDRKFEAHEQRRPQIRVREVFDEIGRLVQRRGGRVRQVPQEMPRVASP